MIRGRLFIGTLAALFLIRLVFQSQIVVALYEAAWPGTTGLFFTASGDTPGYINPWKNVLLKSLYSEDGLNPTANRMPYTGLLFFLAYLLVRDDIVACNIVAILQILLGSIATLLLSNLCYQICLHVSHNRRLALNAAIIFLIAATLSLHTLHFDGAILSDGPAISFLSLFIFYYYRYLSMDNYSSLDFIWSSIFLAMTCLWRPYFVLLYPVIIGFEFRRSTRITAKPLLRNILLLVMPIVLLDLPWIIRNYITLKKFIPAQSDIYAGSCDKVCRAYRDFAKIAGGTWHAYPAPNSFACYFESEDLYKCTFRFPFYMLGDKLNIKEIEKVKALYARYKEDRQNHLLQDSVIQAFSRLSSYYRQDHPYLYWLYPRLITLKSFLIHTATFYFPTYEKGVERLGKFLFWVVKSTQAFLYWIALIGGFIGLIRLTIKRKESYILLFIPMYLIGLFPVYFMTQETRYFYAAYPMLLIGASYQIGSMLKGISLWKLPLLRNLSQKLQ